MQTELDIARKIAAGELESPQKCGTFWLFALRVTGTGASFRPSKGQFVYRPPEHYLHDEFLQRVQGLPVVWVHPPKNLLDTAEYRQRSIGAVMLPYINGSDVWAVCRIYDANAAQAMQQNDELSTSPSFYTQGFLVANQVLVESEPEHLDHLAVCIGDGVWDKSGEPTGISTNKNAEVFMPDPNYQEFVEDKSAGDGGGATVDPATQPVVSPLDEIKGMLSSLMQNQAEISERITALETKPAPAAPAEGEMKADSAEDLQKSAETYADAADRHLQLKIGQLENQIKAMNRPLSPQDENLRSEMQRMAEPAVKAWQHADSALAHDAKPNRGESPLEFTRRLAQRLQSKCKDAALKTVNFANLDDATAMYMGRQVFADAANAATGYDYAPGEYHRVTSKVGDITTTQVVGDSQWEQAFTQPPRRMSMTLNPGLRT